MDVQTMQAIVGLLGLLVTVFGGLLLVVWVQLSSVGKELSAFQIVVARDYVTKEEHDRRIVSEVGSIKELVERIEVNMTRLLEMNQHKRGSG